LGVALFGLQRGLAPREVAGILVDHRAELRRCYRDIVAALPAAAFEAEWAKSRGAVVPLITETFCACMIAMPSSPDPTNSSRAIRSEGQAHGSILEEENVASVK
jgi:hypothetical protein